MKGFIVYPTYRIKEGKAYVYLFGRLENGKSFLTMNSFKPYFFIKKKDRKKAEEVMPIGCPCMFEDTSLKDFDEEEVTKVITEVPKDVPNIRKAFGDSNIAAYEADIRFPYRFMMDHGIRGSVEIEGGPRKGVKEKGEYVDLVFEEPVLTGSDYVPKLRVLSFDIETDMDGKELYSISLYTEGYQKALLNRDVKVDGAENCRDEVQMLHRFVEELLKIDPDIITGWNVIDFDLQFLKEKFEKYKIPFQLGRIDWDSRLRIEKQFFIDSKADFPGRMVLDGIQILKTSFISLSDYKLETASQEILGEGKIKIDTENKGEEIVRLYKEDPAKLVEYNMKDSKLVYDILERQNLIELTVKRSLLTGMQLDRVRASIASLDSLYLREARKRGYVCPSVFNAEKNNPGKGGFVMKPKFGVYDYVLVLDFKSLYPSIIRTFNIDPQAFSPNGTIEAPNGAKFLNTEGILPAIIQQLWKQRDKAKKEEDKNASYAIKITMNSFYGSLSNPTCRFFNLDVSNAITYFGQFIIKMAAQKLGEKGYNVIYGDTDSVFVNANVSSVDEADRVGKDIQDYLNRFLTDFVKKEYDDRKSFLELEFEKIYKMFLMPKIRGSERGAKKRYAGLLMKDGEEEIDIVGLEFVRRDWTQLAKGFQYELLDLLFHKKGFDEYIRDFVASLKRGEKDDLLVYKKALSKDLDEYVKTTPPHVKAARKKKKMSSNVIAYVMTTDGPEPVEDVRHDIDYKHYIDKQLAPIAESILTFFDKKFEDVVESQRQRTLSGF